MITPHIAHLLLPWVFGLFVGAAILAKAFHNHRTMAEEDAKHWRNRALDALDVLSRNAAAWQAKHDRHELQQRKQQDAVLFFQKKAIHWELCARGLEPAARYFASVNSVWKDENGNIQDPNGVHDALAQFDMLTETVGNTPEYYQ